ncbi:late secretory pathway protein avl9 [Bulinus truncatus]|nr:late secretory pathway protein avl9 [Bulinus truncatus]
MEQGGSEISGEGSSGRDPHNVYNDHNDQGVTTNKLDHHHHHQVDSSEVGDSGGDAGHGSNDRKEDEADGVSDSFVIGATNILFKQRRQLLDAFVEVVEGKVEVRDKELQKQLSLTTADLRFADYLVKIVTEEKSGLYLDGTEWEGSDEWVRAQFKHYLNSLLCTVIADDNKLLEDFGTSFLTAWKTTHNFRFWNDVDHPAIRELSPGHPFQGNLSMADVRVRFNHTLQSTERGRKLNAAVVQTGKYVVQTGKVFGGAFTSAKSAVSGWFSSWRHNDKTQELEKDNSQENLNQSVLMKESVGILNRSSDIYSCFNLSSIGQHTDELLEMWKLHKKNKIMGFKCIDCKCLFLCKIFIPIVKYLIYYDIEILRVSASFFLSL